MKKWYWALLMMTTCNGLATKVFATDPQVEVAACLFSPTDMLRQPKSKLPVLADSTFNCGIHGDAPLVGLYGQGWRLIQVLPNGAYTNPWIGIFERHKQ